MTTKEKLALRKIFNDEMNKYSDDLFSQFLDFTDEGCYVKLTEEILDFLEEMFPAAGYKEDYYSYIGETVYMAVEGGDSIFPLEEFKRAAADYEVDKRSFDLYTLYDMEENLNGEANGEGFKGIIDYETNVGYRNFQSLFILSMLRLKNSSTLA